jgi:hypothetical protein
MPGRIELREPDDQWGGRQPKFESLVMRGPRRCLDGAAAVGRARRRTPDGRIAARLSRPRSFHPMPDAAATLPAPDRTRDVRGAPLLVHNALGLIWLPTYARFVVALGGVLRRPHVRRAIDRATGAVRIGLGIRVAVEQR